MDTPIVDQDGKKVFIGQEDSSNPPPFIKSPTKRYCNRCHTENTNDKTECIKCGTPFDDNKMQCPVCHCFFDSLIGENANGGIMGCEAHWKPSVRKEKEEYGDEIERESL